MKTFTYLDGGYTIENDGILQINQPFDPRTGEPFKSREEAEEYAKDQMIETPPTPTE